MLERVRSAARAARRVPVVRSVIAFADRLWWARTVLRAEIVDEEYVRSQLGRELTPRRAVWRYVTGGFRSGFGLNPLACERTISRQLPDSSRVPALYAYLVADRSQLDVSPAWDSVDYAHRFPAALADPAGPLGHAWRSGRRDGSIALGPAGNLRSVPWREVQTAYAATARTHGRAGIDAPIRSSILFVCRLASREMDGDQALSTAAAVSAAIGARVVVLLDHPDPPAAFQARLTALGLADACVYPAPELPADELNGIDVVVERGPFASVSTAAIARLAREGARGPVSPLWLAPDGTVASAGVVFHGGRAHHLLAGYPAEDARRVGDELRVPRGAGATRAWPVIDPAGPPRTILDISVTAPAQPPDVPSDGAPDTHVNELLAPAGLEVEAWPADGSGPRLRRVTPGTSLRWAIRTAAPAGPDGESWGDTHFARALARALRRLGQQVVVDAFEARHRSTAEIDDVTIVLRGPRRIDPPQHGSSILWVISHPDEIRRDEATEYDRVFAASIPWAREATRRLGVEVVPLLQCTDAHRFRPDPHERNDDIVFVGTARGIARPSVVAPLRAGIPIKVYGPDWRGFIPGSAIVATSVPNEELPRVYGRARAVLNDHWPAMRKAGFISNRPYDVVAAGGRVVSDDVQGLHQIFDGAVVTYETTDELIDLLAGDLDAHFPHDAALRSISERVRREESFDARARVLLDAARSLGVRS